MRRLTAAAGSTARTAAARTAAAWRRRGELGFPMKSWSSNTARPPIADCGFRICLRPFNSAIRNPQSAIGSLHLPHRGRAIRPHGLDRDRRYPLAFERPLYGVAGEGSKVIDVAEMDEKDRSHPARRRPNHRPGRGIIREMAGGAQDAILQEPGLRAD